MANEDGAMVLSHAARDVLEKMFFSCALTEAGGWQAAPGSHIGARLEFQGDARGVLELAIARSAARSLAANFLGAEREEEIADAQVGEVVCELANMICGSVLSRLDFGETFQLSSPELQAQRHEAGAGALTRSFDLGNGWLAVCVEFRMPYAGA